MIEQAPESVVFGDLQWLSKTTGFSRRSWEDRIYRGVHHPPFYRVGRRILFHKGETLAWIKSRRFMAEEVSS